MARPSTRSPPLSKEDSEFSLHGITPSEHHDRAQYLESFKGPDAAGFARLAGEVPVLRGYLKKQMTRSKWKLRFFASWQTRYFILYPGYLVWSTKEGGKITGLIPLETYHYVAQVKTAYSGRQFDMLIHRTPTQRHTFCFLAADEEGASQWVKHIKIVIRYFGNKVKPTFDTTGKFWKKPELMLNVGMASQPGWENKIRDFLNEKQGKSASQGFKPSVTVTGKDHLFRPSASTKVEGSLRDPSDSASISRTGSPVRPSSSQKPIITNPITRVLSDPTLSIRPSQQAKKGGGPTGGGGGGSEIKKSPSGVQSLTNSPVKGSIPITTGTISGDLIRGEIVGGGGNKNPLLDMDALEKELLEGEESDDEFEAELVAEEEKKAAAAAKKRAANTPKTLFGGPIRPTPTASPSSSSSSSSSSSYTFPSSEVSSPAGSLSSPKKQLTISTSSASLSISTSSSLTPTGVSFPQDSKKDTAPEKAKTKEQEEILQAKAEAALKNKQMLQELEIEQKQEEEKKAARKKDLMALIMASAEEEVKQKVEEEVPKCDECEDDPIPNATVWCSDCEQNLCKKCDLAFHHGNKVSHQRSAPRAEDQEDDEPPETSVKGGVEMTPISNLDLSPGGRSNELGAISEERHRGRSISGTSTPSPTHLALSTPPAGSTPTGTPISASPSFSALQGSSPVFKPATPSPTNLSSTSPSPTTTTSFLLPATSASISSTTTAPRGSPVKPVEPAKQAPKKKGKGHDSDDDEDGPTTAEEEAEINRIMGRGQPPKQTSGLSLAERQQQRMMAMAGKKTPSPTSPTKSLSGASTTTRSPSPQPQPTSPARSPSPNPAGLSRAITASPTPVERTSSPAPSVTRIQTASPQQTKPTASAKPSTSMPPPEPKPKKEKEKKGLFGRIAQAVTGDSDDDDDEEDDGEDMQEEIDRIMRGPKPSTSTNSSGGTKGLSLAERAALAHSRAAGRG